MDVDVQIAYLHCLIWIQRYCGMKRVGDITIRYDPPRRGRVIPMAVHQDEAHDDIEDGGS